MGRSPSPSPSVTRTERQASRPQRPSVDELDKGLPTAGPAPPPSAPGGPLSD